MCTGICCLNECEASLCREISSELRNNYLEKAKTLICTSYSNEPWVSIQASQAFSDELHEVYEVFVKAVAAWSASYAGTNPAAVDDIEALYRTLSSDVEQVVNHYRLYLSMLA